uniref:sphingomyelin phosphodiesterase n=1 Tax=Geotrypetes seraphini TaxID=260995 RepID=A0A6P8QB26_GEOSA|nr:sphingomyelin phosphodiesterase 3-like isoform X1 [Geotrypetes seraphini]XP_033793564.1 sphingomyelin phosphodiesterase 3-like isoform X1 [Geotrypetes seraphini]XP_033793569.1 sphingomyelin phosphodiesterase 3-like isoform X1 [Geotrypetes seraphini]
MHHSSSEVMALQESPFPNCFLHGLHSFSWALIFPCYWVLDRFLASLIETSVERKQRQRQRCSLFPLKIFCSGIVFLMLLALSLPIAFIGFIFWVPLQALRRPFDYQRNPSHGMKKEWLTREQSKVFNFTSANLCFLPDGLARFSNLSHTQRRSIMVAKNIIQGATRNSSDLYTDIPNHQNPHSLVYSATSFSSPETFQLEMDANSLQQMKAVNLPRKSGQCEEGSISADPSSVILNTSETQNGVVLSLPDANSLSEMAQRSGNVPCNISSFFPLDVDFVCLQEVFDKRAATTLRSILSPYFEHILYNVGVYGLLGCSDFKFFNSGLFLASRYPVLSAQYHHYPNGCGEDALAAKGLLCVKVQLGEIQGQQLIGYLNCTHLHAPEADGHIRCAQLDFLIQWITQFQETNSQSSDIVAFDVLCGDLNFDNCSSDDHLEQGHRIFDVYKDPCREGPRKEKDWAIGTLLRPGILYDNAVLTPENMKRTLEMEDRMQYIAAPINPDSSAGYPETGPLGSGRRIDYILYREETVSRTLVTDIKEFMFITQLAGLTDHIPIGMQLSVSSPAGWD